ncbi:GFA family protein [Tatumella sp. JGM118]|uniref:GFA family protein n=1 Tax=Tatumella sp. JGM118 TaxID=2799796 RepID=UPI001BAF4A9E|nr:GFA family protein [Tatumella sp. JGM118]MBS0910090.1 GFA family protein [Tatumella sp. JGM118]
MGNKISGHCHCGIVTFSVELLNGFETIRRCDCSLCRMRGAVVVSAELSGIEVLTGRECLTEYRFNTKQAVHYFCSKCGIYTFHQRRSNPGQYGVNVACLEGISPFDFAQVQVMDGIHHPEDGGNGGVAGILSYRPINS